MIRRASAAAVALATAASVFALPAAPALAADDDGIDFSRNGSTWVEDPLASVFPGIPGGSGLANGYAGVLVPGGSRTGTFFIRNSKDEPGQLSVVVMAVKPSSPDVGATFHLAGRDDDGDGLEPTAVREIVDCTELIPTRVIEPGESVQVTAEVSIPATATGKVAQNGAVAFELRVGLADETVAKTPDGCPLAGATIPSEPGDTIATTGAPLVAETLLAALGFGALGWLFVLIARRRRRDDEQRAARA